MAKIEQAEERLYRNIFICRKCNSKIRTTNMKVTEGKVKCRKCNSKALRTVRKK